MNPIVQVDDHVVQNKKETVFLTSYPTNYVPGKMNPLNNRIIRQTLNIDSRFRDNYYAYSSANFHYDLPLIIKNVVSLQLVSMDFPCAFYNVSNYFNNNYFTLIINSETFGITIPDGNYGPIDFISYINNILSTAPNNFKYILFSIDISNSISGTGKVLVGIDSSYNGPIFQFSIDFVKDSNSIDHDKNKFFDAILSQLLNKKEDFKQFESWLFIYNVIDHPSISRSLKWKLKVFFPFCASQVFIYFFLGVNAAPSGIVDVVDNIDKRDVSPPDVRRGFLKVPAGRPAFDLFIFK
jgi:hypothetical protein